MSLLSSGQSFVRVAVSHPSVITATLPIREGQPQGPAGAVRTARSVAAQKAGVPREALRGSEEDSPEPEQVIEGGTANEHRLLPWLCFDFILGVVTVLLRTK